MSDLARHMGAVARRLKEIGFRPASGDAGWMWGGKARRREQAPADPSHAFAALAELRSGPFRD